MPKQMPNPDVMKEIVKQIERISSICGQRPGQIFEDWLQIVEQTLLMLPEHLKSAIETHQLGKDTPEAEAIFAYMHRKYPERCWEHFTKAFAALLEMPEKWI